MLPLLSKMLPIDLLYPGNKKTQFIHNTGNEIFQNNQFSGISRILG